MGTMASQITNLIIAYSTVYSGAIQRKHQSSASLAFVLGIHRVALNSPHKWPVTWKMFPFDDVIMDYIRLPNVHNISYWYNRLVLIYRHLSCGNHAGIVYIQILVVYTFKYIFFSNKAAYRSACRNSPKISCYSLACNVYSYHYSDFRDCLGYFYYDVVPRNWLTENMASIYTWRLLYRIAKLYLYALACMFSRVYIMHPSGKTNSVESMIYTRKCKPPSRRLHDVCISTIAIIYLIITLTVWKP